MHALHQVYRAFFYPHSFRLALPDVWAGFQVNIKMMFIAEALVLVLALAIAIVRGLPGPAAKPLRALAIATPTSSAACRTILVSRSFGFGVPGAPARRVSNQHVTSRGSSRSRSSTPRT